MRTVNFEAIGTRWVIDIFSVLPEAGYTAIKAQIRERIEEFDKTFSRFRQDSLVTQMAHAGGEYHLPEEGVEMLSLYQTLYDLTGGAFTPLIGSVMEQAGYDASYSLRPKKLHTPRRLDDVFILSGRKLFMKEPALLDFGAVGKGKLIDIVAMILEEQGISNYCVDAGGDIRYRGTKFLRVGLEHPEQMQQVIGVAKIKNQSIAASAGNRRKWGKFHHIIHPHTLISPQHILATWVVTGSTMLADAIATALFLIAPDKLIGDYQFSYVILLADFSVQQSKDFPAELYYN
jgi:FAD:protein FMN transferase